jgi:hypothetical protein
MAVELIGFQLACLQAGILKFTFQAIDLVPECESLIDQLPRIGGHSLEIGIETGDRTLAVSDRRRRFLKGPIQSQIPSTQN